MRKKGSRRLNRELIKKFEDQERSIQTVDLYCCVCGDRFFVKTTNLSIYTEEVKKKQKCNKCRNTKASGGKWKI